MTRIIECVPNFSEGRDLKVIDRIVQEIRSVKDIKILGVEPGFSANRTVITFAGNPDSVIEGAFRGVKMATELIDMQKHQGVHPCFGATDVCPLVPISGITMQEVAEKARFLAKKIGNELGIPVYCYEHAAFNEERKNLSYLRKGNYEALKKKMSDPNWKPDFGPMEFNPKSGTIAVGARETLIAYNVNLATKSLDIARLIAGRIREKTSIIKDLQKKDMPDIYTAPLGPLKSVKAISWYIAEYGKSQVSTNILNFNNSPIHIVYETIKKLATEYGTKVTGSELIGLIPLKALLDAGKYYLDKQHKTKNVTDMQLIDVAVASMGLNELKPFKPKEKIIEYAIDGWSENN